MGVQGRCRSKDTTVVPSSLGERCLERQTDDIHHLTSATRSYQMTE